ncbi:MAG: TPM domain-containing protein [Bacteroidales bacterium]|nr:TPM domain-containing protein [Bacteroidales bacterium]
MKRISIFAAALILFTGTLFAQKVPDRPYPPRLVNDLADVLTIQQENEIESFLVDFSKGSSTQIVLITITTLNGYDKADFTYKIGEEWGVGQAQKNNGIVMLVKPKTPQENGEAFIAVGYGLEAVIPDAIASRIVNQELIPAFKNNNYYQGIAQGLTVLTELANGEYPYQEYKKEVAGAEGFGALPILLLIIFYFLFLGRRRMYYNTGKKGSSLPFWLILWGLNSGRSGSNGYWNEFNSGRGHFGGGNSGFGGFGGGSFGGGGAGGSW